jgi:DNA gyrase subunit A
MHDTPTIPLADETQRRYLNYALSVITSRALPDVRDGLKPVQRRILYTMYSDLHLTPDARYRKCAKVVGDVMGNYHPHGDTAIYDALVRMAQDFSLRYPFVDGHGNFGSIDGDGAAAYRYTECKLYPLAVEMLDELKKKTVDWRPNYDGTKSEPVMLPARVPNLLVNGAQGIAVGMATSIPPHNLGEVVEACVALVDDPELESKDLLKYIKGPDFPTGGFLMAGKKELKEIYESGSGSLKLRGEWKLEEPQKSKTRKQNPTLVITSIPYGPTKQSIVEKIAEIIRERKLPQLVDVLDQSTTDIRIELEIKKDSDPELIMNYLYKNTALLNNVQVNLTCLVPTENPEVGRPERLNLKQCVRHFLDFRFDVITRRLKFELDELERRIHILEGFATIYDALDEVLRIIRKSEGKQDAADKLMKRFKLDDEQVDAILELKLYRLARLEILMIQQELGEKKKEQKRIEGLLKSEAKRWHIVKDELNELVKEFGDKRKTKVGGGEEVEFDPNAYIVDEDANVVLTRDGWVKRVRELKDVSSTRTREGDEVVTVLAGNTKANIVFFSSYGAAYVCRIVDIPASTGYGDPVQKLFKFDDGEKVIAAYSLDARVKPSHENFVAISKHGYGLRFAIAPHLEVSTRTGRKFARTAEGDEIISAKPAPDGATLCVATYHAHELCLDLDEINLLANPGRGVTVVKLNDEDDRVVGFTVDEDLVVESEKGKEETIKALKKNRGARNTKGSVIWTRKDRVARIVPPPVTVPQLAVSGTNGEVK